jgi:hypothetical protein
MPAVSASNRSMARRGGPTLRPLVLVQPPPRQVSRIATRTRAGRPVMSARSSAKASDWPRGKSCWPSEWPE